ncbi:MAG TPA: hypothetical protein VF520_01150 [Thermoleophilaceae bacterium]|jgi:predicted ATP-grasp superfamily ATP-dependent carboligase
MAARPAVVFLEPANGGLATARSLVRAGERVTMLASPGDWFTARTRGARGRVLSDLPEGREEWLSALAAEARGGDVLVLTGADRASELLAEARGELPPEVRTFESEDGAHLPLMDKALCHEIAQGAGVRVPWTAPVASDDDLRRAAADAPYPCVVKPAMSHEWRALFGMERVLLAHDAEELEEQARPALDARLELIVSEYVPGGDDSVEEAIVVRTADGSYPVSFGCRKIRQCPPGFGAASLCVSDPVPESAEIARAVLDHAGFVGVAGVETKRHAATGEHVFLEVNVRLPTQFGLGDAAGVEASKRLYATLAGHEVGPQPPLVSGVKLVFPQLELRLALPLIQDGSGRVRALREMAASYRGVREAGVFDLRDPVPGLALLGSMGRRAVTRLAGRPRRR